MRTALSSAVDTLQGLRRRKAEIDAMEASLCYTVHALAEELGDSAGDGARGRERAHRMVHAELGAAVRESERTIAVKIHRGAALASEYPIVLSLLEQGELSVQHAHVIVAEGEIITDPVAREKYEREIIDVAVAESVGRLRPVAKRFAEQFADHSIEDRHAQARECRSVSVEECGDGMADLVAHLPAVYAFGIKDRLDQYAQQLHAGTFEAGRADSADHSRQGSADSPGAGAAPTAGGPRLLGNRRERDQVRADILTELLLTGVPFAQTGDGPEVRDVRARVQVVVPTGRITRARAATGHTDWGELLGEDLAEAARASGFDSAAVLDGYGPIDIDTALKVAAGTATWERVHIDSLTGEVVEVDTYRPSMKLRRLIEARDGRCRFPNCTVPARKCDLDHTVAASEGGPTSSKNLGPLCRRHHTMKHATPWQVRQTDDGMFEWLSPTGRDYRDESGGRVRFRPIGDDLTMALPGGDNWYPF